MGLSLRHDPTRTTMLQKRFIRELSRRFRLIQKDVKELVVDEDAFGLTDVLFEGLSRFTTNVTKRRYQFLTTAKKVDSFREWLANRINTHVLSVDGSGNPWTYEYIHSGYRQGLINAYTATNRLRTLTLKPDFYEGTKAEWLRGVFAQPETMSKLELLATRDFEQLKAITADMSARLSTVLADGLSHGWGPLKIAREMHYQIFNLDRVRCRRIARTEIINAHAEGQLDAFEKLGVDELNLVAEWMTAGDELVCTRCQDAAAEGPFTIDQARGMIPLHPNCRCMWAPAFKEKKKRSAA